ncbi:hypothetical protein WKI71_12725 [Streptomyces sp. MS1.AVA.1]|uniref:Uncharacterized protein n=1 Tax=Streptomyces machairae TaxID=3134109 RepID=A0ABU8UJD4_9ACTN
MTATAPSERHRTDCAFTLARCREHTYAPATCDSHGCRTAT